MTMREQLEALERIQTWQQRVAGLDKPTDFAEAFAAKREAAELRAFARTLLTARPPAMSLSELIEELSELKAQGEPSPEWRSIDDRSRMQRQYWERIHELRAEIDRIGRGEP